MFVRNNKNSCAKREALLPFTQNNPQTQLTR